MEVTGSRMVSGIGGLFACLLGGTSAQALDVRHAGLIEIDWMRTSLRTQGQRELTTDTAVATLELGLTAQLTPAWHSDLLLLAEDIGATDHNEYIPAEGRRTNAPTDCTSRNSRSATPMRYSVRPRAGWRCLSGGSRASS